MEKLAMCRICLAENVRMYVVVNRNLQKLYEKLTDIPFVTEDIRPILACFFCCTKLKQCYQLLTQCLEAEEVFARRMTGDCEPNPVIIEDHHGLSSGLIKSPIVHISIVDECQTERVDVNEELLAVCEGLDDVIEPKEEHESDDLELENMDEIFLDVADIPPRHSESDLEDDDPLIELKTEEEEVSKKKRRAREMKRATVAKEPKLDTLNTKQGDSITPEQTKKEKSNTQDIRLMTTRNLIQEERKQIILLHRQGLNISQIAVELNMQLQELCGLRPCGSYKQKALITLYELRRVLDQKLL